MSEDTAEKDADEFIQCPHEAVEATCVGSCNCPCEPCAPSRDIPPGEGRA